MPKRKGYQTRQKEAILRYFHNQGDRTLKARDLRRYFEANGDAVSLATIYRHLDRLTAEGLLKKIVASDVPGVFYQLSADNHTTSFYLKCESCGTLLPIRCHLLDDVRRHILSDHGFMCNPARSILYGTCASCSSH